MTSRKCGRNRLAAVAMSSLLAAWCSGATPKALAQGEQVNVLDVTRTHYGAAATARKPLSQTELYSRVWSLIRDEYYDQSFNRQDWARWEHRYDGKLANDEDTREAIKTMLASLGDRYTRFLGSEQFDEENSKSESHVLGVGVQIGMDKSGMILAIALIEGSPAAQAGVQAQDEISEINGASMRGMSVEEASKLIRGPVGTEVTLTVLRNGNPLKVTMKRAGVQINPVQTAKMIAPDVGYIRLTSLTPRDASKRMSKALADLAAAKGLILDLRSGSLAYAPNSMLNAIEISDMFLEQRCTIVSSVDKDGYSTPALSDGHPVSQQPLVILINRGTACAAEIVSAALQDNKRASLVGQPSFGDGLIQGLTKLDNNTGVYVTIARWLTPNRCDINRKGVTPDVTVEVKYADYRAGHGPWFYSPDGPIAAAHNRPEDLQDTRLVKALEVLKEKMSPKAQ